ncbi:hypothetical protein MPH_07342 [Macrophomina phaseolina MS6]|uniref:Uncharacterized protein n=1 Tax=Macrophomina phaseolina (strain MS6) TaxID=1126212 RepID=K2QZN1_MACPH|nr:hypothetical protein MPH_07342 [Macrophomina phaseolina MS6]
MKISAITVAIMATILPAMADKHGYCACWDKPNNKLMLPATGQCCTSKGGVLTYFTSTKTTGNMEGYFCAHPTNGGDWWSACCEGQGWDWSKCFG